MYTSCMCVCVCKYIYIYISMDTQGVGTLTAAETATMNLQAPVRRVRRREDRINYHRGVLQCTEKGTGHPEATAEIAAIRAAGVSLSLTLSVFISLSLSLALARSRSLYHSLLPSVSTCTEYVMIFKCLNILYLVFLFCRDLAGSSASICC